MKRIGVIRRTGMAHQSVRSLVAGVTIEEENLLIGTGQPGRDRRTAMARGRRGNGGTAVMSPAREAVAADVQAKIDRERERKAQQDRRAHEREQAETALTTVAVKWRRKANDTEVDGDMVVAVAQCLNLGTKRQRIAEIVTGNEDAHRGAVARLVMMARWHMGRLRKGEAPLIADVELVGHKFREPVAALRANVTTMTAVFTAFSKAYRPAQAARAAAAAQDPMVAARAILRRAQIIVAKNGKTERIPVVKNSAAFLSLMIAMLDEPIAAEALGGQRRVSAWQNVLREHVGQ